MRCATTSVSVWLVKSLPLAMSSSFSSEILDDPVMDDGHRAGHMGMGIGLVGHAMGGPAGMADAGRPVQWLRSSRLARRSSFPGARARANSAVAREPRCRPSHSRDIRAAAAPAGFVARRRPSQVFRQFRTLPSSRIIWRAERRRQPCAPAARRIARLTQFALILNSARAQYTEHPVRRRR